MTRAVRISEPASEELIHAVGWYEARRQVLGGAFLDAVAELVTLIETQPEIGSVNRDDPQTRRVLVRRLPYQVVYRLTPTEVVIVAVGHLKRRPGHWRDRS